MQRLAALFLCSVFVVASVSAQQQGYPLPQPPAGPPPMPAPPPQAPPPPPPQPVAQYYVEENGQPVGPLSLDQVRQRVLQGQLQPTTVVWKTGLAQWTAARSMEELTDAFKEATPPEVPLDARIEKFMLGAWETEQPASSGMVSKTTIRYYPNGDFKGYQSTLLGAKRLATTHLQGKWQVTAVSDQEFNLVVIPNGEKPATFTFQIINHTTLKDKDDGTTVRRTGQ